MKHRKSPLQIAALLIALLSLATAARASGSPLLTTPSGPVRGTEEAGICTYKGIPYARPPMGDLRFAPPEDVAPWTAPLDAVRFGATAVQAESREGLSMSEDCLTLNIWTPAAPGDGARLPVYVFIHGGGYAQGGGAYSAYDGTSFARNGIVTITINYRLNALGFFASQETYSRYGTTGNWGHLDQIKALEWIRDNIAAFGGDPQRVTIGGESAGSYSVSALILSPLAEGLFQGAIMESGSILSVAGSTGYAKGDLKRSIELCGMMAWTFGAQDDAEGLTRLRQADANVLAQLSPLDADFTHTSAYLLFPVYDGKVLPRDPLKAIDAGNINRVRLLFGYNDDEGSIFVPAGTSEAEYAMLASRMFGYERGQAVLERFPVDSEHSSTHRARQALTYAMFSPGMRVLADAMAERGLDVYAYRFSYVSEEDRAAGLGARHAAELAYVFNRLPAGADRERQKLADEMHLRWVNFIRNGDPNIGETPPTAASWPLYRTADTLALRFDTAIAPEPLPDRENMEFMRELLYGDTPYYEPSENTVKPARSDGGGCRTGFALAAVAAFLGLLPILFRRMK